MTPTPPFLNDAITRAFAAFPDGPRDQLLQVRAQIFDLAAADPRIGPVGEALKWGQPSYASLRPRVGTPIRLGITKAGRAALFVHCQSSVIAQIAPLLPPDFDLDGTRALHLSDHPKAASHPIVGAFLRTSLTYRL